MDWMIVVLFAIGALAVTATVLPLWRTTHWWIRVWDFPRFQVALVALGVGIVLLVWRRPAQASDWVLLLSMLGVVIWQSTWIAPYLPGAPRQLRSCPRRAAVKNDDISLLTTNVLQTSRGADRLITIVREADPDVFFAVEVDEWWVERLVSGLRAKYAHNICYPLSNGYGVALFSRRELIDPQVRFVLDEAIPSVRTGLRLRSGAVITVYGVHPRPPSVQQPSTERDLELLRIAEEIKAHNAPSIVLGDLNDVAWSPTTNNFTRAGALLDPRRGRGFFNTYPARWPGLRYPLDYIFSTGHFRICTMRVLPDFGSDHLPLMAEFRLVP